MYECRYKIHEACEETVFSDSFDSNGNQWACIVAQKERGMEFAAMINGLCYGSKTCRKTIQLDNAVTYELDHCTGTSQRWYFIKFARTDVKACHEFVLICYFRSFSSGMDMLAACGDNELGMIITPRNNTDIHSPHYPGEYPSSINCKWRIKADHGYQVKLHIMGYELEEK